MKLDELASLVHVYPTVTIGVQQLAAEAAYGARPGSTAGSCDGGRRRSGEAAQASSE